MSDRLALVMAAAAVVAGVEAVVAVKSIPSLLLVKFSASMYCESAATAKLTLAGCDSDGVDRLS